MRVIRITEEEIRAGFHDYEINHAKRTAICRRCGVSAFEAMNSKRKAMCRGAKNEVRHDGQPR